MIIKSIEFKRREKYRKFNFSKSINLIYSKENSKGKTTLLRLILYGLGYNIPATDGIGEFSDFSIRIIISNNSREYILERHDNEIVLYFNNCDTSFILPDELNELHSEIFCISNFVVLDNLLGIFYIDQEKGWTLLNRGVIIGKNRFNIEEFISALSDKNIEEINNEITKITDELKKYKYLKSIAAYKNNTIIESNNSYKTNDETELYNKRNYFIYRNSEINNEIKRLSTIILDNNKFIEFIDNLDIYVSIDKNNSVRLSKHNILNFNENQVLLNKRKKELEIELLKNNKELKRIDSELDNINLLSSFNTISDEIDEMLNNVVIDEKQIDKHIQILARRRDRLKKDLKTVISYDNPILLSMYDTIIKYAKELGIDMYINGKQDFVLTNKLKGKTGRVLVQMSFVFKIAYIREIENKYGLVLPIIIDSPRTSELTDDSSSRMMKILERDFRKNQIIFASVYRFDNINKKTFEMKNNLFD